MAFIGLPESLSHLMGAREFGQLESVDTQQMLTGHQLDYIHLFTDSAAIVDSATRTLTDRLSSDGMIWISWPKIASKVPSDVTEDVIREFALRDILVDVKVCAVDHVWSALKLVVRKIHREEHAARGV